MTAVVDVAAVGAAAVIAVAFVAVVATAAAAVVAATQRKKSSLFTKVEVGGKKSSLSK